MKENIWSRFRDASLISFPVLMIFFVIPVQIYLSNQIEFQYEQEIIFIFLLIYLIFFFMSWVLVLLVTDKLRLFISAIAFFTGLYVNLSVIFIPVQVGELVGKNELDVIAEPILLSFFEILLCAGLIVLAIKISWYKARKIGAIYAALTLFGTIGLFFIQAQFPERKISTRIESVSEYSVKGTNVYHLIFDAFDSILFEKVTDTLGLREAFNGFVFFKNNICNYTTTSLSIPSLMTGKFLDGEIKATDFKFHTEGIIKSLKDHGYRISQYDMFSSSHIATDYWVSPQLIDKDLNRNMNILKLADLSILVAAPNYLQNECFKNGKGLASRLILSVMKLPSWNDQNPMVSISMIDKMIKDESSRSLKGEYVFAHFMIPHPPYVYDHNCNFIGKQSNDISAETGRINLINQNCCAVNQMVKIIENLKKEGKFESSLIIIQSDHGELKRSNPLLIVKKPMASNFSLTVSGYYTHLLDIAPTILDAAGLNKDNQLMGRSLIASELSGKREFPMAQGLSKSKEFSYYTISEGVIVEKHPTIFRTDIP